MGFNSGFKWLNVLQSSKQRAVVFKTVKINKFQTMTRKFNHSTQ